MKPFIVTLTYRVLAKDPDEAIEAARDLAFEDTDPASSTAFPEVKAITADQPMGA